MTVSRRLRFEVLRRDGHRCRYCGATAELTIDHVQPVALGGSDDPTNLVAACKDCNSGKSSVPPDADTVADVAADAFRWKNAMELVICWARAEQDQLEEDLKTFESEWSAWALDGRQAPLPDDWSLSVERWLTLGLEVEMLAGYMRSAMCKQGIHLHERWRYFCGVVWRHLDKITRDVEAVLRVEGGSTASDPDDWWPALDDAVTK